MHEIPSRRKFLTCGTALVAGRWSSLPAAPPRPRVAAIITAKRLFDECVKVIRETGRPVPIFCDKHLSYRWDWAKEMVDTARELKVPLMAGSSVPLAQRWPDAPQPGGRVRHAVSIHGGRFEGYDIHALEILQSVVEARGSKELGIRRVQYLGPDALWEFARKEPWLAELGDAAMASELGPGQPTVAQLVRTPAFRVTDSHAIILDYRDGLRAAVLKVGSSDTRWNLAYRPAHTCAGPSPDVATRFYVGPWANRNLFKAWSHAIQAHFRAGQSPYPVERTLLTTGALCAAVDSRAKRGDPVDTPHLQFEYTPRDFSPFREDGASWKVLPEGTPEPIGITRGGITRPNRAIGSTAGGITGRRASQGQSVCPATVPRQLHDSPNQNTTRPPK